MKLLTVKYENKTCLSALEIVTPVADTSEINVRSGKGYVSSDSITKIVNSFFRKNVDQIFFPRYVCFFK